MEKTMNIMNMEAEQYQMTTEESTYLMETATEMLTKYGYNPTAYGLGGIFDNWSTKKAWIINLFKKSENYVDGKFYIKVPAKLKRGVNREAIRDYIYWAELRIDDMMQERELKVGMFTLEEYINIRHKYNSRLCYMEDYGFSYKGHTAEEYRAEVDRMTVVIAKLEEEWGEYTYYGDCGIYVTRRDSRSADRLKRIFRRLRNMEDATISNLTEDDAIYINNYLENNVFIHSRIKARAGMSTTKFYGKLCVELGFDKIVDIQKVEWTDPNTGEVHFRTRDMGYNHFRPMLGDSINPTYYDKDVYISVNPLDFWGMSLGWKWASCQTIDKDNVRHNDNNYSGCYSSGTESLMGDGVSFIVYTLPEEDSIRESRPEELDYDAERKSKLKRCIFMMGEDKLIQSRLYPDGRDGGDEGLASQLRAVVQAEVAKMLNANNMWTLRRGSSATCDMIHTDCDSTHYRDYEHYNDVNVSFLHRINGDINTNRITVGSEPICPHCGCYHTTEECIECDDCYGMYMTRCDRCGDRMNEQDSDAIYVEDTDTWYCCDRCASDAGNVETADGYWHNMDNCLFDSYTGEYYYVTDMDDYVTTYDGNSYISVENCLDDGNQWCIDIDDYSNCYVYTEEGNYYHCVEDLIEVDGRYYEEDSTLENEGYVYIDGEWVKNDEEVA